jgi:predicted 3-demethylubiquinone-9 3-methyltransferase (glyoxalase superfamily)
MGVSFRIAPCIWFVDQAEAAAHAYVAIFPNSRIVRTTRYAEAGREIHQREVGSVMTVDFELDGHRFTALNGGPLFTLTEAISFQVFCEDQAEIDHYWAALGEGGDPSAQQCGWLKDRFGVSWQVVPTMMNAWFDQPIGSNTQRGMEAMFTMKKLDIAALQRAYDQG